MRRNRFISASAAIVAACAFGAPAAVAQSNAQQFQTALDAMGFHNAGTSTAPVYQYLNFVGNESSAISAAESFGANVRAGMAASTQFTVVTLSSPVTAPPQSQTQSKDAAAGVGALTGSGAGVGLSATADANESALLLLTTGPLPYSGPASAGSTPAAGLSGGLSYLRLEPGQCGAAIAGHGGDGQDAAPTAPAGQGAAGGAGGAGGRAICYRRINGVHMAVAVSGAGGDGGHATAAGSFSGGETTGLNGGAGGAAGVSNAVPFVGGVAVALSRSGGAGGDGGFGSSVGGDGGNGGTPGLAQAAAQVALAHNLPWTGTGGGRGGDGGHSDGTGGDGGNGGTGGQAIAQGDGSASAAVFAEGGSGGDGGDGGDGGATAGQAGAAGSAGTASTSGSSKAAGIPGYAGTPGSGGSVTPPAMQSGGDLADAARAEERRQRVEAARLVSRSGDQ